MNKNAIKNFAIKARTTLINKVKEKLHKYGITNDNYSFVISNDTLNGVILSPTEKKQLNQLIDKIKLIGFNNVVESVAYTWFNRFCALRFMEVNGYLPSNIKVFSNNQNEFKPEILEQANSLSEDLYPGIDLDKVFDLYSNNKNEELFKYLIVLQCNSLNSILPKMFQKLDDYTVLLFPENLLRQGSVLDDLVTSIPEDDWKDAVQIIGWLYQYYNSEPKDKIFSDLKKNIKISKDNIPAATQLFTPDWIVRYMVENSLGRLWLEGHENQDLRKSFVYYVDEAKQEEEVQLQLDKLKEEYSNLNPADIKCIDPCMGSGHILVYMFDVLMQIYESQGYIPRDAVKSIIENNIYGLDIDERATQLSYFAIMMKARQYDSRFFSRTVQPNIFCIEESNDITDIAILDDLINHDDELDKDIHEIIEEFKDAKEYGSIINVKNHNYKKIIDRCNEIKNENLIFSGGDLINNVLKIVKLSELLSTKYHVVVTNPPYMGASGMNPKLSYYVKEFYPKSKSDLSTVFMQKCIEICNITGFISMINIPTWMFLSSFEELRNCISCNNTFINMIHPGRGIFGSDFGTTSFVIAPKYIAKYKATFFRLFDKPGEVESISAREQSFLSSKGKFIASPDNFSKIPGSPIAYWVNDNFILNFDMPSVENKYLPKFGMSTGNSDKFIKNWYEVNLQDICVSLKSSDNAAINVKWVLIDKGGPFRKWYGNINCVVWWKNNGADIKANPKSAVRSPHLFFKPHVSWTLVTSGLFSSRYFNSGFALDSASNCIYSRQDESFEYVLAFLNSCVATEYLRVLNPTLNTSCGVVGLLPYIENNVERIGALSRNNIEITKRDWNSFEISMDFSKHPFIIEIPKISEAYQIWVGYCELNFNKLKSNEEELNRFFIDVYGLQSELLPEVEDNNISVSKADLERDIKSFISYAVGCMLGRYSLDKEGLVYAGGEFSFDNYKSFYVDLDNIIPITDNEYFADDIVTLFVNFVKTVYGPENLQENLKFISDALGGKGESLSVIRNYFINNFFIDHCKVYQKRPIYWLFDSGKKNAFKALIYMHRYNKDTLARMRTDYVLPHQRKYLDEKENLENRLSDGSLSNSEQVKLKKQLSNIKDKILELKEFEEKLHHLADQMIEIDLDDGVKHNYEIFSEVLAKIK